MPVSAPPTELGAGAIAAKGKLTLLEVAFVVARIIGFTQEDAYRLARPKVTKATASTLGCKMDGRLRNTIDATSLTQALSALGDVVAAEIAMNPKHPDRLAAAKELNKVAGRYRDSIEASDLTQLMTALTSTNQPSISAKSSADESVETIMDMVDLTRKPSSK